MDTHSFAFHPLCFKEAESKMLQPQEQRSPRVGVKVPGKQYSSMQHGKTSDVETMPFLWSDLGYLGLPNGTTTVKQTGFHLSRAIWSNSVKASPAALKREQRRLNPAV